MAYALRNLPHSEHQNIAFFTRTKGAVAALNRPYQQSGQEFIKFIYDSFASHDFQRSSTGGENADIVTAICSRTETYNPFKQPCKAREDLLVLVLPFTHVGTHILDVDVTKDTLLMIGKDQGRRLPEPETGHLAGDDLGLLGFAADTAGLEVKSGSRRNRTAAVGD
ncbi:hypothetical protein G3M48_001898, partial [Beauveria asiatica]